MFKKIVLMAAAAVVSSLGVAHAGTFSGSAYCGISSTYAANSPTLAQLGNAESTSGGLCATFTGNNINFAAGGNGNSTDTLASFLGFGGATSTFKANGNGSTATGSQSATGTLLDIIGNIYLQTGSTITLSHDDGALLYFNGVLISPSGGSSQTVAGQSPFTYTGASGSGNFELIYTSNYIPPSSLMSNINNVVTPEPSSLMLLGTGLLSAGTMALRRRRIIA